MWAQFGVYMCWSCISLRMPLSVVSTSFISTSSFCLASRSLRGTKSEGVGDGTGVVTLSCSIPFAQCLANSAMKSMGVGPDGTIGTSSVSVSSESVPPGGVASILLVRSATAELKLSAVALWQKFSSFSLLFTSSGRRANSLGSAD